MKSASVTLFAVIKVLLFIACCVPICILAVNLFADKITGDPVETMTRTTGIWALRLLLITLAVTPLRQIFKFPELIKLRRMLGLFSFFYAVLHMLVYVVFDQFFDFQAIITDVVEKKFIFAGMTALLLMVPLAATSTNGMVKRLGGKNWRRLHRLIYVIAIAAVVHFIWLVKADLQEPLIYAFILLFLLGYRLWTRHRKKPTT